MGLWIFIAAGGMAIIIALLTVSFQAIKAALANPVKSLRSEWEINNEMIFKIWKWEPGINKSYIINLKSTLCLKIILKLPLET